MNKYALFAIALFFTQSAAFGKTAKGEFGNGLCSLDGTLVTFERVGEQESQLILSGVAPIDDDTILSYHFNPFYGIGGQLSLRSNTATTVLLRWENDFSDPIVSSSIVHNGRAIECSLLIRKPAIL